MLTIQGHLTKAWAHLNEAQALALTSGDAVLVQFIGQAIDDVEIATERQRVDQPELLLEFEVA